MQLNIIKIDSILPFKINVVTEDNLDNPNFRLI
jgi:hypothetical protein